MRNLITGQFAALMIFLLFVVGGQTFATASLMTRWHARDNAPAVYVPMTELAKYGFKGTFS